MRGVVSAIRQLHQFEHVAVGINDDRDLHGHAANWDGDRVLSIVG
jgi:hypothetical protein